MFNVLFFHPIFSSSRNHNKTTTLHLCQTPTQQHTHLHSIWLLMCACCLPCRLVLLGNLFAQFVVVASHVHRTGTRGRTAKVARAPSTLPPLSTTIPLIVTRPKMINTWVYFGRGSLLRSLTKSLFNLSAPLHASEQPRPVRRRWCGIRRPCELRRLLRSAVRSLWIAEERGIGEDRD